MKPYVLPLLLSLIIGCSGDNRTELRPPEKAPDSAVYFNGRLYTLEESNPWAEALVTQGDQIAFVGSNAAATAFAGDHAVRFDLGGQVVLPGIIDSHTHPGLVAILGGDGEEHGDSGKMPGRPREKLFEWLEDHASTYWWQLTVMQGEWDVAEFLPEGPNKNDLDAIFRYKPTILFDNSGHSLWVNSSTLRLLGVDKDTPDLSDGISYFVRDERGELTGWVKEFALMPYIGDLLLPEEAELKERFVAHLNFMSSRGVTTVWDAGNFDMDDAVYKVAAELDRANLLPVRYEGSYHIWNPTQIDGAKDELLRLRRKYEGEKLKFNTVKIHFDGVAEVLTAGMLEPYDTDPGNRGGVLFTAQRLSRLILELDKEAINLHLHVVGDRATRTALDALELAESQKGKALSIEFTLSHLETVHPNDITRFVALGVHANFTPHWFGGTVFGEAGSINLGPERSSRSQVVNQFFQENANVTLSSDVVSGGEAYRADPFIGLEMSVTRQEFGSSDTAPILSPAFARLSREDAIAGYTINGAKQLGQSAAIGSLAIGKLADFVVLDRDPFTVADKSIHRINPVATVLGGQLVNGVINAATRKRAPPITQEEQEL